MKRVREFEKIEISLLLEGIFRRSGYDFRSYDYKPLVRKINNMMAEEKVSTISGLQEKMFHDPHCMDRMLFNFTENQQPAFDFPEFYRTFRRKGVPALGTYPYLRIWQAGCASVEEVYSLAILLKEEGLYDRAKIYATDVNDSLIERAKSGVFPYAFAQKYARNYASSGGKGSFSDYFSVKNKKAAFDSSLKKNIFFTQHNLATDHSFNEFNMIFCRNLLVYFNADFQEKVHQLFHQSLCMFGLLGLGERETLDRSPYRAAYEQLEGSAKLYKRIR